MTQKQHLRELRGLLSIAEMARQTGIAKSTIRDFLLRDNLPCQDAPGQTISPPPVTGVEGLVSTGGLDVPIRPLNVALPSKVEVTSHTGDILTALLWGDTHFPNQDNAVLAIVRQIAEMLRPNFLVHMGDLLDCYELSDFDQNPYRIDNIQSEIDLGRSHLAQMRLASPESSFLFLEGNHEDRLRRTLWRLKGPSAALAQLTAFKQAITWPSLLGLNEMGVTFVPYDSKQAKKKFLPKWILKHGNIVRKYSGYTARGEMEKYGRSGSSGHSHRLGVHMRQDHNGNHCWVETGCTCSLEPEYMSDPDWQQGCVVLTFEPVTGAFQAEPIYIYNGLAVWRGCVYRA